MKASKCSLLLICATAFLAIAAGPTVHSAAVNSSARSEPSAVGWYVQVYQVDPGKLDLSYSFQAAIYENLVKELKKTQQFQQVFRAGDRRANEVPNLLILKTTVEKYKRGSETQRAVTTVSGATRLTVRSQILTREGKVILERTVNGNVRFFGSNLRATLNLARNIVKTIKESCCSDSLEPIAKISGQL